MTTLNDQFKSMTPAQKTFVLSMLVNKVLKTPKDYGITNDGVLKIGDKLNFTKLFENNQEIKSIFDKALQTIISGSPQEKSILTNNEKIASWIKENPNAKLTNDKVAEILGDRPKKEVIPEPIPEIPVEQINKPEIPSKETGKIIEEQIQSEIAAAKSRLAELEGNKANTAIETLNKQKAEHMYQGHQEIEEAKQHILTENPPRNPNLIRSFDSDTNLNMEVERAFSDEIDHIYGKQGLMGLGKMAGTETKEWKEMARLPASKVVEYYTGDSVKSGLDSETINKLSKTQSHNALMRQMIGLMEQTSGTVKPFEGERVESFIKRLGGFVLRTSLKKAA